MTRAPESGSDPVGAPLSGPVTGPQPGDLEQAILGGLRETGDGMTVLVVAYRMATIQLADHIVYLEQGQVVDQGTHAELLVSCEGYGDLVNAYAREAAERAAVAADEETV